MNKINRRRRSRPFTGQISCDFAGCPRIIKGGNKAGMFSNYNSHVLAAHEGGTAPRKGSDNK